MNLAYYHKFCLLVLSTLLLTSCKDKIKQPPPQADFFVTNSGCVPPCELVFKNSSKHSDAGYSWDFGNGELATTEDAIVRYNYEGAYEVTLTAYNESGEEDSKTKLVYIAPALTARITKIDILNLKFTNPQGLNWDSDGYPDVFIDVSYNDELLWDGRSQIVGDLNAPQLPTAYNMNVVMDDYVGDYYIDIMDNDDPDSDELMHRFALSPEDFNAGDDIYPLSLELQQGDIHIMIHVEWL